MNHLDILIEILSMLSDQGAKAVILESFIQQHGPIPDAYGDIVRMVMEEKE